MGFPVIWYGQYGMVLPPLGLVDYLGNPYGGGAASNSFTMQQPITGTTPAADSSNDTLTHLSDGSIGCHGDSAADSLTWSVKPVVTGTRASPVLYDNTEAILVGAVHHEIIRVAGDGGAKTGITIDDGTVDGQIVTLQGCHATNTLAVSGAGLVGDIILRLGTTLTVMWDDGASVWVELSRNYV